MNLDVKARLLEIGPKFIEEFPDREERQKESSKRFRANKGELLDLIYREDERRARTGRNAENLCTTRAMALNLTRLEATHKRGIKGRVKRAGWDNSYLEKSSKFKCVSALLALAIQW